MINDWPLWAQWFHAHRQKGDVGVGDTAKRVFAVVGGERFRLLRQNMKLPCKCALRQTEWNFRYPYD